MILLDFEKEGVYPSYTPILNGGLRFDRSYPEFVRKILSQVSNFYILIRYKYVFGQFTAQKFPTLNRITGCVVI